LAGCTTSDGQASETPVHSSAASQAPAAGRQTTAAPAKRQSTAQQASPAPFRAPKSHCSVGSTTPSPHVGGSTGLEHRQSIRHVLPFAQVDPPGGSHCSSASTTRSPHHEPHGAWLR